MHELSVARLVRRGVLHNPAKHARNALDRAEVERVSLERYRPGHPYWMTGREVAEALGVCGSRARQLVASGQLPGVKFNGQWFYRRTTWTLSADLGGLPRTRRLLCYDPGLNAGRGGNYQLMLSSAIGILLSVSIVLGLLWDLVATPRDLGEGELPSLLLDRTNLSDTRRPASVGLGLRSSLSRAPART
jgi:hypothetical protein